ncbi:MAG TPA: class I SAM-dependent methyltransferase [Planctomycetota bacterium]|nr:class I SAM-dependent methyltransferase [Planctomycetota bacterium]
MGKHMPRQPRREYMDEPRSVEAYATSDFSEVNQAFVDRLFELTGPAEVLHVIDLGTGPGDIPLRILRVRPGWRIVALEASPPMLDFAKKAAREAGVTTGIHWFQADAKGSGLPGRTFDVVFSNTILHHISETELVWEEVKRVGKRGALVFFRDLARPATPEDAHRIVETYGGVGPELMRRDYYNSLLAAYTVDEVRAQLSEAGLDDIEVTRVTDRHWDAFGRLPDK